MRRRALLSTLAAGSIGLAGCSALADEHRNGTTTPTDDTPTDSDEPNGTPAGEPPESGLGMASIVTLETVPRTLALAPIHYRTDDDAEVRVWFERTATPDTPAVVRAHLRNAGKATNMFDLGESPPFSPTGATSDQPRKPGEEWADHDGGYRVELVLAPTDAHELAEAVPEYELGEDGTWRLAEDVSPWLPERVSLDSGEVVEGEYVLLGRADGAEHGRPTGTYDFHWRRGGFSVTAWDSRNPGPDGESRFAGEPVPQFPGEGDVAWYHEAGPATPSWVQPETEHAELPARVDFTFVNHHEESTECGKWDLYKLVDGQWFRVAPWAHTAECRILPPGGEKTWTLRAFSGDAVACDDFGLDTGHLGGGVYAGVAGYGHSTSQSGALVELDGPAVEISLTDDASASRDGERVTVTTDRWGDDAEPGDATLTVSPATEPGSRLIPEQVMRDRYRALRNGLAPFRESGVAEVVVRTGDNAAERVVGYDSESTTVSVDGDAYEARIDRDPGD